MQAPASPPAPGESELVTLLGNVQEAGRGAMKPRAIERAADEISANQNLSPGEQMLPIHPAILDTMSLAPCRPTRAVFLRERCAALTLANAGKIPDGRTCKDTIKALAIAYAWIEQGRTETR